MAHIPVLLQPTIENLRIKEGETVVDATLGLGGHAKEICRRLGSKGLFIGLDQDERTLKLAEKNLQDCPAKKIFCLGNFRDLSKILVEQRIARIDAVLFDLGFSSEQMDNSGRGFTFQKDEPLLMTLADKITEETLTAREIVNDWSEESLADIIYGYGEERFAKRIAQEIVFARNSGPIQTTNQLVEIIKKAVPFWYLRSRRHFATKTFQALRIAVNDELRALKEGLVETWEKLAVDGRLAIITFHGLEAKIVKDFIREKKKNGAIEIIIKSQKPDRSELIQNPRSRSAQLTVVKKQNLKINNKF